LGNLRVFARPTHDRVGTVARAAIINNTVIQSDMRIPCTTSQNLKGPCSGRTVPGGGPLD